MVTSSVGPMPQMAQVTWFTLSDETETMSWHDVRNGSCYVGFYDWHRQQELSYQLVLAGSVVNTSCKTSTCTMQNVRITYTQI